jgi:hypothetical protein
MLCTKTLSYQYKIEVNTMYNNVSMEHNSNIDQRGELQNKSLNNRRTSSKYPNTFIHHNSHVFNNEYMISIYTYSYTTHEAHLLLGRPYYIYIYILHVNLEKVIKFDLLFSWFNMQTIFIICKINIKNYYSLGHFR